ncbi:MAG: galactose mutarotase [Paracoccaceae bacterium]|nr:galactose mutarotase [Paracoccaceae bacterium]MDG1737962.1 galactose mutarotase [Paracoccaceae bacterium]MDG2257227.1 galactose mutarotase [Paracoccaceae bacterium]
MIELWGEAPDGTKVNRVRISNGDLTAHILSFGATVQDLRFGDSDFSLVLGYPNFEPYKTNPNYFGSTVGRFANRISHGRTSIDGQEISLDRNYLDKHHLHGGSIGASFRNWSLLDYSEEKVVFGDILPDGHMGFPGNLTVTASFEITPNNELSIKYESTTDAPTLCNFAPHSYFNLDGTHDLRHHSLLVNASAYLPVDEEGIPKGCIDDVAGTSFDFRNYNELLTNNQFVNLDHNFCVDPSCDAMPTAVLSSNLSSIELDVRSTEPGLQVYTGAGISGNGFCPYAGIALEPQVWPDAPNRPNFPNCIIRPGEVRSQQTMLGLSRRLVL